MPTQAQESSKLEGLQLHMKMHFPFLTFPTSDFWDALDNVLAASPAFLNFRPLIYLFFVRTLGGGVLEDLRAKFPRPETRGALHVQFTEGGLSSTLFPEKGL